MHSIVVLGDSRRHTVTIEPSEEWKAAGCSTIPGKTSYMISGGANIMRQAIEMALGKHLQSRSIQDSPIFSYRWPDPRTSVEGYGEMVAWKLMPVRLPAFDGFVTRLMMQSTTPYLEYPAFPDLDDKLVSALSKHDGTFESPRQMFALSTDVANAIDTLATILTNDSSQNSTIAASVASCPASDHFAHIHQQLSATRDQLNTCEQVLVSDLQTLESLRTNNESGRDALLSAASMLTKMASHYVPLYWQVPTCPDVVVFDDLNLGFRDLPIETAVHRDGTQFVFEPGVIDTARKTLAESDPKINPWDAPKARITAHQQRNRRLSAALTTLLERFDSAHRRALEWHDLPVMEPVILASIADSPHTIFAKHGTLWSVLRKHKWLCDRTVILLGAEDLRRHGLPISTGLSWERTAQDTIVEMRRSPDYRPFLEFGQVIVRFGVTGALHIVRHGATDWSYSLFFDAEHDDVIWTNDERDGVVLGSTAAFVASIVESIAIRCRNAGGHPFLSAFPDAVRDAMFEALGRCRKLTERSYGKGCYKEFINQMQLGKTLPSGVFPNGNTVADDYRFVKVPVTSVPSVVLRDWSILSQSVQTQVGDVARDIVRIGPSDVLNQPPLERDRQFAAKWQDLALRHIGESVGRFCKQMGYAKASDASDRLETLIFDGMDKVYEDRTLFGSRSSFVRRALVPVQESRGWKRFVSLVTAHLEKDSADLDSLVARLQTAMRSSEDHLEGVLWLRQSDDDLTDLPVAPIIRYGRKQQNQSGQELIVVDRREIEGYRAIEKLMRTHIDSVKNDKNTRPLSIAIFGPPGSGKSTAVKSINETLADTSTKVLPAFNLSQFASASDLNDAFTKINQEGHDKLIPIAFFDEFDCKAAENDASLGWLKYFLAPMEDGVFRGNSVKNAILVFAGGTKTTFNDFSLIGRPRDDSQWIEFSDSKGPDFVSRLRGHLNIVGINPADPDDQLYLIRRALLIRTILSRMQRLSEGEQARIDENMLRAILHVPTFWHGGRAVRMLLELCSTGKSGKISASSVPPIQQLNMLVDGKAFLDLLNGVASDAVK